MEMAGHNSQIYRTSKRGNSPVPVLQIPINLITGHKLSGRNVYWNWRQLEFHISRRGGEKKKKKILGEQSYPFKWPK